MSSSTSRVRTRSSGIGEGPLRPASKPQDIVVRIARRDHMLGLWIAERLFVRDERRRDAGLA